MTDQVELDLASRRAWLQRESVDLANRWITKYQRGQAEHHQDLGGLSNTTLLDELEHELLDAWSYIRELRRRGL